VCLLFYGQCLSEGCAGTRMQRRYRTRALSPHPQHNWEFATNTSLRTRICHLSHDLPASSSLSRRYSSNTGGVICLTRIIGLARAVNEPRQQISEPTQDGRRRRCRHAVMLVFYAAIISAMSSTSTNWRRDKISAPYRVGRRAMPTVLYAGQVRNRKRRCVQRWLLRGRKPGSVKLARRRLSPISGATLAI
jgi:hypothetical protein